MKKLLRVFDIFLRFLPYLIVSIGSLFMPSDPDLGWHLKYGEYFAKHGSILRDNTFSVMMPDFHWANVSWGTDVITYFFYHLDGFLGLSLLSALIVTATFYFISNAARFSVWDQIFLFPLLLYLEKPINSVSFRGQQISLLLLAVLFYILAVYLQKSEKDSSKKKILYLLIPLFFLWTNLHGEFLLGLGLFFGWIILYLGQRLVKELQLSREKRYQEINKKNQPRQKILAEEIHVVTSWFRNDKKELVFLLFVFSASCLVTLINPFGIGVHQDAISHFGSPLLKSIAEYLPFDANSQPWWNQVVIAMLLAISLLFLFFNKKLPGLIPLLGCGLLLFLLSFEVRRYAWPAYYLIIMFLSPISGIFKPDGKKVLRISSIVLLIFVLIIILSGRSTLSHFTSYSWDAYCQKQFTICSPKSAEYLSTHPKLTENLYSLYGWGGWLIWNYPTIKPTIDGRMHLWKDEKGYSGFVNYYNYEQNMKDINKSNYQTVYLSPDKPLYDRMKQFVKEGKWKQVYVDQYAGIFVRDSK